jgi:hypothetical protein
MERCDLHTLTEIEAMRVGAMDSRVEIDDRGPGGTRSDGELGKERLPESP